LFHFQSQASSLFNGFLPSAWRHLVPGTQKGLGSWMNHFQRRYRQYKEWADTGKEPKVMWLSGLHIPTSYLTALVQTTCRKKKWPLDKSTLYTTITQFASAKDVTSPPADGCYIQGLYLEGAAWDSAQSRLVQQKAKQLVNECRYRLWWVLMPGCGSRWFLCCSKGYCTLYEGFQNKYVHQTLCVSACFVCILFVGV
jgi:hypothetical protein